MQIIINVPDKEFGIDIKDKFQDFFKRLEVETREHINNDTELLCGAYELETIKMFLDAFKEMRIIPNNATNGDMVKAMFPHAEIRINYYTYCVEVKLEFHNQHDTGLLFDKKWWNKPYKIHHVKGYVDNV